MQGPISDVFYGSLLFILSFRTFELRLLIFAESHC